MSAHFNVAHGAGLAVVLPAWMKWFKAQRTDRLEQFSEALFGVRDADSAIEKLTAWFSTIGAPVTPGEAEIPEQSIETLVDNAMEFAKSMGMEDAMTRDDMVKVLHLAAA